MFGILRRKLESAGVRAGSYSLGQLKDMAYCFMSGPNESYEFFYSERGNRYGEKIFNDYPTAEQEFIEWVIEDPTTHANLLKNSDE